MVSIQGWKRAVYDLALSAPKVVLPYNNCGLISSKLESQRNKTLKELFQLQTGFRLPQRHLCWKRQRMHICNWKYGETSLQEADSSTAVSISGIPWRRQINVNASSHSRLSQIDTLHNHFYQNNLSYPLHK